MDESFVCDSLIAHCVYNVSAFHRLVIHTMRDRKR